MRIELKTGFSIRWIALEAILVCSILVCPIPVRSTSASSPDPGKKGPLSQDAKIRGMLLGSAIGDAAGGPVEFVQAPERSYWCTTMEQVTGEGIAELAGRFRLRAYEKSAEPFAQWEAFGPEGTITDDTRFKMILFNTLKDYKGQLSQHNFARSVLDYRNTLPEAYKDNYDEWIPEIAFATEWALGNTENAYPPERIWGGIPTMEGQMPFLPIAALHPGDPEWERAGAQTH